MRSYILALLAVVAISVCAPSVSDAGCGCRLGCRLENIQPVRRVVAFVKSRPIRSALSSRCGSSRAAGTKASLLKFRWECEGNVCRRVEVK